MSHISLSRTSGGSQMQIGGTSKGRSSTTFFVRLWNNALHNPQFVDRFGALIEPVEKAADTIVDDMMEINFDIATRTLIHTDLNPSNVLVFDDMPYIIDWGTAHVGSLYLDLPHHLTTLGQAEVYRIAMEQRGYALAPTAFARSYTIAARYTGLRYLWWTLTVWLEDQTNDGRMGDALRKHDPPLTTFLTMFVAKIGRQSGLPIEQLIKTERVLHHLSQKIHVITFPVTSGFCPST